MGSNAYQRVSERLRDVDELLAAHELVGKGRRWARGTGAINRACIILLTSHLEGFVEDLFVEAFALLYPGMTGDRFVKTFNSPNCRNIDDLFEFLGIKEITKRLSFTPVSNAKVREAIDQLVPLRHQIAHGKLTKSYVAEVRSWRGYLNGISKTMDVVVGSHLQRILGRKVW